MQSRQSCEWCSSGIALNYHDAPACCFLAVFFKRHGDCPIELATTVLGLIKSLSRLPSFFYVQVPAFVDNETGIQSPIANLLIRSALAHGLHATS